MGRAIQQVIPRPPAEYDQHYIAQLTDAINRYISQREAPAEVIAARYIATNVPSVVARTGPPAIPADDIRTLATGTLILKQVPGTSGDQGLFLTVVTPQDEFTPPGPKSDNVHRSVK